MLMAHTRVLDTLRLRDWTPDAHYVGPVQTRGRLRRRHANERARKRRRVSKQGKGEGGGGVFEGERFVGLDGSGDVIKQRAERRQAAHRSR